MEALRATRRVWEAVAVLVLFIIFLRMIDGFVRMRGKRVNRA